MNQRPDPDNDPTLDRLLQQAFASRDANDSRASLQDVRQRARRHQRRRAGAMVGAAALVGAGGVAVLSRDGKPATTAGDAATTTAPARVNSCAAPTGVLTTDSPIAGVATTTTFQFETTTTVGATGAALDTIDSPVTVVPTSGVLTTAPPTSLPTTTTSLEGVATTIEVQRVYGCLPPGAFRCSAPLGADDQGFTYYAFCEPADGGWTAYPTTTVDPSNAVGIVIVDSSGGLAGAADDMAGRLQGTGLGVITVMPGTRTFQRTMLMPMGDRSGLDIVRQLTGIDGFDTWSSDLINAPLPPGTLAVVVIGQDYWTHVGATSTSVEPPQTTTTTTG